MATILSTPPPEPIPNEPSEIYEMLDDLFRLDQAGFDIYQSCRHERDQLDAFEAQIKRMASSAACPEALSEVQLCDWLIEAAFYNAAVETMKERLHNSLAGERQTARQIHLAKEYIYSSDLYVEAIELGLAPELD
jgi:hypothetical protein